MKQTTQLVILSLVALTAYFGFSYLENKQEPVDLTSIENRLQALEQLDAPTVKMSGDRVVPVWDIVDTQIRALADFASTTDKRLKELEK